MNESQNLDNFFQKTHEIHTQTHDTNLFEFINNRRWYPVSRKKRLNETLKSLIDNKTMSDVTFLVDGEYLAAHRLLLSLRSDVFETMFYGMGRKQDDDEIIQIVDVSLEIFRQILIYIYTDETHLNSGNVVEILYTAHKYNLAYLEDICEKFIIQNLTSENVLDIINDLHALNAFESLKKKLFAFVCKNFYNDFNDPNTFVRIKSIDLVKHLLQQLVQIDHEPDNGRLEYDLFGMLINWGKKTLDDCNDLEIVRTILENAEMLIDFDKMSVELLNKCIAKNQGFFSKDEICKFFTRDVNPAEITHPRNSDRNKIIRDKDNQYVFLQVDKRCFAQAGMNLKAILPDM